MPNIKPVSYQATIRLLSKLIEAENRVKSNDDWMNEDQVKEKLGV